MNYLIIMRVVWNNFHNNNLNCLKKKNYLMALRIDWNKLSGSNLEWLIWKSEALHGLDKLIICQRKKLIKMDSLIISRIVSKKKTTTKNRIVSKELFDGIVSFFFERILCFSDKFSWLKKFIWIYYYEFFLQIFWWHWKHVITRIVWNIKIVWIQLCHKIKKSLEWIHYLHYKLL